MGSDRTKELSVGTKRAIRRDGSQSVRGGGVQQADWMGRGADAMAGRMRRVLKERDDLFSRVYTCCWREMRDRRTNIDSCLFGSTR